MPSASPRIRAAVLATCVVLIGAGFAGCETTQEKAAKQQVRAEHILKERERRQKEKKAQKKRERSEKDHEGGKDK